MSRAAVRAKFVSPDCNPGGICVPGLQSGRDLFWPLASPDLFSMLLGVIVVGPVGLARHEVSRERGLTEFDRYSMLLDVILVGSVGLAHHEVSRERGLSGFDRFSMLLGVVLFGSVGLARHEVSRERGLSGFDRYSMLSDTVLERFGAALSDLERPSRLSELL